MATIRSLSRGRQSNAMSPRGVSSLPTSIYSQPRLRRANATWRSHRWSPRRHSRAGTSLSCNSSRSSRTSRFTDLLPTGMNIPMSEVDGITDHRALVSLGQLDRSIQRPTSSLRTNGGTGILVRRLSFSTTSIKVEFV